MRRDLTAISHLKRGRAWVSRGNKKFDVSNVQYLMLKPLNAQWSHSISGSLLNSAHVGVLLRKCSAGLKAWLKHLLNLDFLVSTIQTRSDGGTMGCVQV